MNNKSHTILLTRGLKIQVYDDGGFAKIRYFIHPRGSGRHKDWDFVLLR